MQQIEYVADYKPETLLHVHVNLYCIGGIGLSLWVSGSKKKTNLLTYMYILHVLTQLQIFVPFLYTCPIQLF